MKREPTHDNTVFLFSQPASRRDYHLGLATVLVCLVAFLITVPFAKMQLPQVWAFMPAYESALIVTDLITAVLLFGQFCISRSRALLVLASGYLFTAMMTVAHALTFPGLFAPGGLLGAGAQSTAWLYQFWHCGFPLFVMAYSLLKTRSEEVPDPLPPRGQPWQAVLGSVVLVLILAAGLTLLATAGEPLLPAVMQKNRYAAGQINLFTIGCLLSLAALVVLWRRRTRTVLDLWLMVVMSAWILDIALSAVFNGGRFDAGFYAGRIYGMLAASFVLLMLLLENSVLYARLVEAHAKMGQKTADLQQVSSQLEIANAALAEKNHQLEESSRLKSEFLSNMSHELRTPLNAIIGFSEMMKDGLAGDMSPSQNTYVGHVFHSGQHLLSLINDILDLSKIEAGKVEIELEPLELDTLLTDSVAMITERATSRQIRLKRQTPQFPGALRADRRRLRQIVDNLLSNALKFTPSGGQISLNASLVDRAHAQTALPGFAGGIRMPLPDNAFRQFVVISVSDTGIGISPEDAARLFTPFTQISNPLTRTIEGTGLGLAMVRRLVELHDGTVAVSSEPGQGSCFSVWLPWREEPGSRTNRPHKAAETQTAGPLALVVEDDEKAAMLMRAQLEAEGFSVRHAASAEAALEMAGECTPDVITLDILLPGMDGWQFLNRLKDMPAWANVPVVVVSVVADEGRGVSLGASMVLQKPVSRDALSKGLAQLGLLPGGGRNVTVLVIDDDVNAVEIIATHLHQSGYTVLRALGGKEGIELAQRFRPDLIALDLEMPEVNGFDVVEALKGHPATAQIPIMVVTAKQLSQSDRRQLNGHILDIVDKTDFNHGRFINEVHRSLSRPAPLGKN
jgi:signal transduction histidine kinase/CheY-like chemotaxis protein